jgi:hypothetical protein
MALLFWSEFNSYLEVKTASEMFIDVNRGGDKVYKIKITFNFFKFLIFYILYFKFYPHTHS